LPWLLFRSLWLCLFERGTQLASSSNRPCEIDSCPAWYDLCPISYNKLLQQGLISLTQWISTLWWHRIKEKTLTIPTQGPSPWQKYSCLTILKSINASDTVNFWPSTKGGWE
jgi:hypothetical protein